jgi:hypothetical protein
MQQTCFYLKINFNLIKIYYFLCFHEHKNIKLNHFLSISKGAIFYGVTGKGGSLVTFHIGARRPPEDDAAALGPHRRLAPGGTAAPIPPHHWHIHSRALEHGLGGQRGLRSGERRWYLQQPQGNFSGTFEWTRVELLLWAE